MAKSVEVTDNYDGNLLFKKGLYINLGVNSNEDWGSCSYDREYLLYPYTSDLPDDLTINNSYLDKLYIKGMKNPVKVRDDKIPYRQYGTSHIDGVSLIMLRRDYTVIPDVPTK